jgi:hypothetical protein
LTDFLIGTGGWAYFKVPDIHPLKAYSRAFNFVEVNSTFYEIPKMERAKSWRRIVPPDFEFSVLIEPKFKDRIEYVYEEPSPEDKDPEILERRIKELGKTESEEQ